MPILLSLLGAAAAVGTALLVSGNVAVAIGAGIGCAIGIWLVERRRGPRG